MRGLDEYMRDTGRVLRAGVEQAESAEKAGHIRTAGQLYFRATNYLSQAERMLAHSDPHRIPTYKRLLHLTQKAFDLHSPRVSRVEIPYEGTTLPAYYSQAPATDTGPAPVIVLVNGLESTKEHQYTSSHWAELAARGISCLMLDQPGTGETLRLQNIPARVDAEVWGAAAVDYLQTREDVAPSRIGIVGWSSAATTPRAPPRSRNASPWSSPGAPTTIGAPCSDAA
jgi:dipeptidyl aminopeptidase/acylaminoacyl peptidase